MVEATCFADRLLIPEPGLRKDLLSFCDSARPPRTCAAGSGLKRGELASLKRRLCEAGRQCLLFMLEDPAVDGSGRRHANAQVCLSLYSVSSPRRQG